MAKSVLVISNNQIEHQISYNGLDIEHREFSEDFNNENTAIFDYACFLASGFDFVDSQCLDRAVSMLNTLPLFSALYSDLIISDELGFNLYRPQPSYKLGITLNCPFLIRSHTPVKFDHSKEHLLLNSGLQYIIQSSMLYHHPEPLFEIKYAKSSSLSQ